MGKSGGLNPISTEKAYWKSMVICIQCRRIFRVEGNGLGPTHWVVQYKGIFPFRTKTAGFFLIRIKQRKKSPEGPPEFHENFMRKCYHKNKIPNHRSSIVYFTRKKVKKNFEKKPAVLGCNLFFRFDVGFPDNTG